MSDQKSPFLKIKINCVELCAVAARGLLRCSVSMYLSKQNDSKQKIQGGLEINTYVNLIMKIQKWKLELLQVEVITYVCKAIKSSPSDTRSWSVKKSLPSPCS